MGRRKPKSPAPSATAEVESTEEDDTKPSPDDVEFKHNQTASDTGSSSSEERNNKSNSRYSNYPSRTVSRSFHESYNIRIVPSRDTDDGNGGDES